MTGRFRSQIPTAGPADEPAGIDAQSGDEPNDDAAVAAGQRGIARRIAKPRAPVAPADLGGMPDVTRPETAAINAKTEISMDEAMALDGAGKLERAVLTTVGWYVPRNSQRDRIARKRMGEAELVAIGEGS